MNSLPPPIPPPPVSPSNDQSNFTGPLHNDPLAIASLVCGILTFTVVLGIIGAPLAFVLGILSLKRIKDEPKRLKGRGMALAGMILGAGFPLLIFLLYIAIGLTGGMPF